MALPGPEVSIEAALLAALHTLRPSPPPQSEAPAPQRRRCLRRDVLRRTARAPSAPDFFRGRGAAAAPPRMQYPARPAGPTPLYLIATHDLYSAMQQFCARRLFFPPPHSAHPPSFVCLAISVSYSVLRPFPPPAHFAPCVCSPP